MPYVNIQLTPPESSTAEQKSEVIKGVTQVLEQVLNKNPHETFVVISEVPIGNWGVGGLPVEEYRRQNSAKR